jgi:NAD+ diphosphatase
MSGDLSATIPFAGNDGLDRMSDKRDDAEFVAGLASDPRAKALAFVGDVPVLARRAEGDSPWFSLAEAARIGPARELVFLGARDDGPRFAQLLDESAARVDGEPDPNAMVDRRKRMVPGRDDLSLIDLRSLAVSSALGRQDMAQLAQAKSLLFWHSRHRFCSNCGAATTMSAAGWRRDCASCKGMHFPRTDPVVIMLAIDGDKCLMGRQGRFGKGMYSALAGFLEPGETVEEAVRREIREESGVVVGEVTYLASQPWPFPASLMIGCLAQALTRELIIDRTELEDARWFTRHDVELMLSGTHPDGYNAPQHVAIAHHLLRAWVSGKCA